MNAYRKGRSVAEVWWCPKCGAYTSGWNLVHITNGKPCRAKSILFPSEAAQEKGALRG
jgi:hypothetical protein